MASRTWRKTAGAWGCRIALACLMAAAVALSGCSAPMNDGGAAADGAGLAARFDGGEVTEDSVSSYTADFRSRNGLEDDSAWVEYLVNEGLSAQTWRERAISALVEDELISRRAEELGIQPDPERIVSQEESDREAAGIGVDDDEEWAAYLEASGKTPEQYRSELEAASVKQQVLSEETDLDRLEDSGAYDEYIQDELVPRVVRRYCVIGFDGEQGALDAIGDMAGLTGDELDMRFREWADRDDVDSTTSAGAGDMGWDIASNLGDAQYELNEEKVASGSLSQSPHVIDGKYYVFYCTNRFTFGTETTYADLPDEDLRQYVSTASTYLHWSDLVGVYVNELLQEANVMVSPMPDGLPYDIDLSGQSTSAGESSAGGGLESDEA